MVGNGPTQELNKVVKGAAAEEKENDDGYREPEGARGH